MDHNAVLKMLEGPNAARMTRTSKSRGQTPGTSQAPSRTLSCAQGAKDCPFNGTISSSDPLKTQFRSHEPKSVTAKEKLKHNTVEDDLHAEYQSLLHNALSQVKKYYGGEWCLPRNLVSSKDVERVEKKRKLEDSNAEESAILRASPKANLPLNLFENLMASLHHPARNFVFEFSEQNTCSYCTSYEPSFMTNCRNGPATVTLTKTKINQGILSYNFLIPPLSSFFLASSIESEAFHTAIRDQAQAHDTKRTFDFILLDPPWPNRSVKRTHKTPGSSYATMQSMGGTQQLVMNMDLDVLMADECLIGIWITNKAAIRRLVLDEGGIFDVWGVELEEEWIWLKTTVNGEPVLPLESVWRKPYEILLLGRKRRRGTLTPCRVEGSTPKQRVLIGVPDLHSRKPCLKELIEPLMENDKDYRALEVFARNLVAGWWSWGNQVLKFNWDGFWQFDETQADNHVAS